MLQEKLINFIILFSALQLISNCAFSSEIDLKDLKDKAYALYATQNYNESKTILEKLPQKEKNEEVYLLLSNIAQENKNTNLAIQYLNKSLDYNNKYYKAYYNLGNILANRGSYILAANNFELAIENNKNFAPAYYNLATCQIKLKDYKNARKNLIKALQLDPSLNDAYYNLALCCKELGQEKQAIMFLEKYKEN